MRHCLVVLGKLAETLMRQLRAPRWLRQWKLNVRQERCLGREVKVPGWNHYSLVSMAGHGPLPQVKMLSMLPW